MEAVLIMEEAILDTLKRRAGAYVSGEQLSRLAGVSRTAIWKGIERLRQDGYRILAQPHTGYRLVLAPDRLIPQELSWNLGTVRIGRWIHAYETTDSTMDLAHRLSASGAAEGTVVVSEGQTKGRGRMGRTWISPKGKGIYASVILRPALPLSQVQSITLMAAVAVAHAIERGTGLTPQIKWPNDLLVGRKKVAGILTELSGELNRTHTVVLGIGINVNTPAVRLPAQATSLAEALGRRLHRVELARTLLVELDRSYALFLEQGVGPLLAQWRGYAQFLGCRVRIAAQGRVVDGQAVDLDETGALLVRTDAGWIESVSAGEVLVVR